MIKSLHSARRSNLILTWVRLGHRGLSMIDAFLLLMIVCSLSFVVWRLVLDNDRVEGLIFGVFSKVVK